MKHVCLWPGCGRTVPRSQWGCRPHWFALPPMLRRKIGRAYRDGISNGTHPTRTYVAAHAMALAWIKQREGENE